MSPASDLVILIPAAGAARRMGGRDKLLEPVAGEPVLARTVRLARATGARVLVTLAVRGPFSTGRRLALAGSGAELLTIDADEGLAASLRAAAKAAGTAAGLMVMLPDMPEVDAADLTSLLQVFALDRDRPVRAASPAGEAGHPVILPARLIGALALLSGDQGARRLLETEPISLCPLPGRHALTDLDTPEEWADWRAGRG